MRWGVGVVLCESVICGCRFVFVYFIIVFIFIVIK